MRKGFTLVELLVVVSIVTLLVALLLPALGRARQRAQVTAVNAELYGVALALEAYALDHADAYPPTRESCMLQEHWHQLPDELAAGDYLPPRPGPGEPMSSAVEDRFNPGHTYKYWAVGGLVINNSGYSAKGARLWVPDGFPAVEAETGRFYNDRRTSPVTWVLYSLGPRFDYADPAVRRMRYPVPRSTWYRPERGRGVITRLRLRAGRHVGSFAERGR